MIAQLTGQLNTKKPPLILLDVHGVGYAIETSMVSFYQLPDTGSTITLHTHLWVREDAMRLYGFTTTQERDLFQCLIKVNGIGAKVALAILSNLEYHQLIASIEAQDAATLVKVPGIGPKTAQRLLLELQSALKGFENSATLASQHHAPTQAAQEAVSALIALGYKSRDAERSIERLSGEHHNCEALIRQALKAGVGA